LAARGTYERKLGTAHTYGIAILKGRLGNWLTIDGGAVSTIEVANRKTPGGLNDLRVGARDTFRLDLQVGSLSTTDHEGKLFDENRSKRRAIERIVLKPGPGVVFITQGQCHGIGTLVG
jgi:hypothetical protein